MTETEVLEKMKDISRQLMNLMNDGGNSARAFIGDAVLEADNLLMEAIDKAKG